MKNIAILSCVYDGDKNTDFDEMLTSISKSIVPEGYSLRVYLHIDGDVSDSKLDIVKKHAPFKVIHSKKNVGLANGLNKLIAAREDEVYFFRMDSDDIVLSERFITQIDFMNSNPSIDMSGGAIDEFIGDTNNIVSSRSYPKTKDLILKYMSRGSPFAHVTVCFRADFFNKFGNYPTNYFLNEDIAYWYKAISKGANVANIENTLVLVRMDDAYSRRTMSKAITEAKVYLKIACWQKKIPIYALMRFFFRLLPSNLVKKVYNSKLRDFFCN